MGIKWEYEVEGFVLSDGTPYLPDFRLTTPQGKHRWVEVKPSGPVAGIGCDRKFSTFRLDGNRGELMSGTPLQWHQSGGVICPRCGMPLIRTNVTTWRDGRRMLSCAPCDYETPDGGNHAWESSELLDALYRPHKGNIETTELGMKVMKGIGEVAAVLAQQKQFEFLDS